MDAALRSLAHLLCGRGMTVAVGSTGFSCSNASGHFVKRLKEMGPKVEYSDISVRRFAKASFAVDTAPR
jgi:hypothetical protein